MPTLRQSFTQGSYPLPPFDPMVAFQDDVLRVGRARVLNWPAKEGEKRASGFSYEILLPRGQDVYEVEAFLRGSKGYSARCVSFGAICDTGDEGVCVKGSYTVRGEPGPLVSALGCDML
mmetsp:Transcript_28786/g.73678  ORF Transcript_28786/g.73678 Transcript_28786/m.73678 type:complete len:119 (-) Transcript_28786:7063-7419(-)